MGSARKILWHDSYASGIKTVMEDEAFKKYTNDIIKYAKKYKYDTVSLTALAASVGEVDNSDTTQPKELLGFMPDNETAYKYINRFIVAAEAEGLSVGLNVYQKNDINNKNPQGPNTPGHTDTIDQLVKDISKNIKSTRPLTIGIDAEDNVLTAGGERSYDDYKNVWESSLKSHGVNYDNFIILGGAAQKSSWTPSDTFKNGFEYYSEDKPSDYPADPQELGMFNHIISTKYQNDPDGALGYIQRNIEAGTLGLAGSDPITGGKYNGIVPVFSIGTGKDNTLGDKKPSIGPAVFGTWEPEPFMAFLESWDTAYPGTTDIIVYHADQLPTAWYENIPNL